MLGLGQKPLTLILTGWALMALLGSPYSQNAGSLPVEYGWDGEGNGNPLQYSCLGNPMDRGPWRAAVHGVAKESDMA